MKPRHWVDSKSDSTGQAMGRLFDYGEVIAQIVRREKTLPRDDEHPCRVWWLDILYSWCSRHCRTFPMRDSGNAYVLVASTCWWKHMPFLINKQ